MATYKEIQLYDNDQKVTPIVIADSIRTKSNESYSEKLDERLSKLSTNSSTAMNNVDALYDMIEDLNNGEYPIGVISDETVALVDGVPTIQESTGSYRTTYLDIGTKGNRYMDAFVGTTTTENASLSWYGFDADKKGLWGPYAGFIGSNSWAVYVSGYDDLTEADFSNPDEDVPFTYEQWANTRYYIGVSDLTTLKGVQRYNGDSREETGLEKNFVHKNPNVTEYYPYTYKLDGNTRILGGLEIIDKTVKAFDKDSLTSTLKTNNIAAYSGGSISFNNATLTDVANITADGISVNSISPKSGADSVAFPSKVTGIKDLVADSITTKSIVKSSDATKISFNNESVGDVKQLDATTITANSVVTEAMTIGNASNTHISLASDNATFGSDATDESMTVTVKGDLSVTGTSSFTDKITYSSLEATSTGTTTENDVTYNTTHTTTVDSNALTQTYTMTDSNNSTTTKSITLKEGGISVKNEGYVSSISGLRTLTPTVYTDSIVVMKKPAYTIDPLQLAYLLQAIDINIDTKEITVKDGWKINAPNEDNYIMGARWNT